MGKHAQIVMGPAGSGKSTYCNAMAKHCELIGRTVHIVNLDPAAENFDYPVSIDIRDLISLNDVVEELGYGPNGGLVYCMEYLMDNFAWLSEQINDYGDDYLIFDCPGQIELYTHLPIMQKFVHFLTKQCSYNLCAIYLLDSLFVSDSSRFISGTLMCLSAMIQLELPHINLLSKCDLIPNKKLIQKFLDPDMEVLLEELGRDRHEGGMKNDEDEDEEDDDDGGVKDDGIIQKGTSAAAKRKQKVQALKKKRDGVTTASASSSTPALPMKFQHLNRAISTLIEQYSMVNFFPLDVTDEESVSLCLQHIDRATAFGEDLEPKEPKDEAEEAMESIQEE